MKENNVQNRMTGAFEPANNEEANGEIMGRCNALHDWLMVESQSKYFSSDNRTICTLMGFIDVIRAHERFVSEMEAQNDENDATS